MTKEEIITKWEKEASKWSRTFNENKLFSTPAEINKAFNYYTIITLILKDLKDQ